MTARRLVGVGIVVGLACASTGLERREYILAHDHGWVEVSVADGDVPDVPVLRDGRRDFIRPDACGVTVRLDREPFVSEAAYPLGNRAPYSVSSGFRFPAPVGTRLLTVEYEGCDVEAEERSSTVLNLPITIERDRVSEVHFDGVRLVMDPLRPDAVVTLDDLYEALTGKSKLSP